MFADRQDAGHQLAEMLHKFKNAKNTAVIGITRGGTIVAWEVAHFLHLPLQVLVVKKIGMPYNTELAMGAVAPKKTVFWNNTLCKEIGISEIEKEAIVNVAWEQEKEGEQVFGIPNDIRSKVVLLVDDGVATGMTVSAAFSFLQEEGASEVILATPLIDKREKERLAGKFDTIIAIRQVKDLEAVGQFYREFPQVSNIEVLKLL